MKKIILAARKKDGTFVEIKWEKVQVVEIHTKDDLLYVNGEKYRLSGSRIVADDVVKFRFPQGKP